MKFYLFITVCTLLMLSASCGSRNNHSAQQAESESAPSNARLIDFDLGYLENHRSDTIDLGRVYEGERIHTALTLRNAGREPFVITTMDLTCGCIDAEYTKRPIKQGENAELTLTLDTRGLHGWIYKSVLMYTSLSSLPYTLYITADVN